MNKKMRHLQEEGDEYRRSLLDKRKNDGPDAHFEYVGLAAMAKTADKETLDRGMKFAFASLQAE